MTKTIEEKYQKLSQREHVLKRPGMYIGSVSKVSEELWVFDDSQNKMIKRFVDYSPGFLKIFDEVLTNATDHATRDPTVTSIKVDINKDTGEISIWNNGTGIPVIEHLEHKIFIPELIFGHLLSGSNYDDTQARTGAGTNGLGSKLSNIFSKRFVVETVDSENKKKFVQEYTNNMETRSKPKITLNSSKSYTKITFLPDYTRFGMKSLETDTIALMKKRVYDTLACTRSDVNIELNNEKIKGKTFSDYIKYFFNDSTPIIESVTQIVNKTMFIWEYAIVPSQQYEQISFVNGNATNSGGKHVDYILYQIVSRLKDLLETKKKLKDVKPSFIKDRMFLFLRATVVNPTFNSQTKETLTTASKDFGCKIDVSETFITKIYKSSIVEEIVEFCKLKETASLAKATDGRKVNKIYVPKLEDALWAGTAKSKDCTLILTEGLSAMTFAMWGRSVVGPERYGVFPMKGKCLNIRDATISQLVNNEELNNIKQILGLKQERVYKDTNDLRYSKVMILTDADVDGIHIKSLLVNFIHAQWPSLLKLDFIQTVRTPIVKAIRGKKVIEFFTEQDYHKWKASEANPSNYQIRYFKGLGTSNKTDAHDTFKRIEELKMDYFYKDQKCDESILLAFEKDKNVKVIQDDTASQNGEVATSHIKCTDKRKAWLSKYNKDLYVDAKQNRVSYQDLINKELIHFSIYDNMRSIPSICDGLKPSQRKILYYMLKKNINKVIKVAQLSGYVSAETGYHHGETSLQQAIIGMAQDFVGSNNINLLYPDGNHGCLDPNTEIILWNGNVKLAKDIKIGDVLIGDDGTMRTVLQTTSGEDIMYKVSLKNDSYIVNSEHILTLQFNQNKKIHWKESNQTWRVEYIDSKTSSIQTKSVSTIGSSNIKNNNYNKSKLTKSEAYDVIKGFMDTVDSPNDGIFDIKVKDFLKFSKSKKQNCYSIKNSKCIEWEEKQVPIDPYIFGSWIGDGNSNASGITSIDRELLEEWVIYLDNINCELTHDKGDIDHGNYHFNIRKKGYGFKSAVGDKNHTSHNCNGCQSLKNAGICDWTYDNKSSNLNWNQCIKKIDQILGDEINVYKILLNNGEIFEVSKNHILQLKFNGHKNIYLSENKQCWSVEYFDGLNHNTKSVGITQNRDKIESYNAIVNYVNDMNVQDDNIFNIKVENYLNFTKYTKSKFTFAENNENTWKSILKDNNLLNNKHIPNEYIINSKKVRLEMLAGIIDTDGCVKYNKTENGIIPYIEISQSHRLRYHIIKSIQFICHSLGFITSITITKNTQLTKKGESMIQSLLLIYGDNLDTIPTRIKRKQILKYTRHTNAYTESFMIKCLNKGKYNGWQLDGNERFLMNNFIITHNSRLLLGKDAASPRYIYTKLNDLTNLIFNKKDIGLLKFLDDDGMSIEPEWYLPIIPMVLVNGCEGIGTGYSTYIPPFNPKDIIANLLRALEDLEPLKMTPYFRNFKGVLIEDPDRDGHYFTKGRYEVLSQTQVKITELPIGMGVTTYKEFLESLVEDNKNKTVAKKKQILLKDVQNKTKDENDQISFVIEFKNADDLSALVKSKTLEKELKLVKSFGTSNMNLFSEDLILSKYTNPNDILLDYFDLRLEYYNKRRAYLIKILKHQLKVLENKSRFISEYISGKLEINKKSKAVIEQLLQDQKYDKFGAGDLDNDNETESENESERSFDYLTRMPIISMSLEKVNELENTCKEKRKELETLANKTDKDLWREDLLELQSKLK